MKNKIIKLAVVAAASVALAQTVQAIPITGSVNFSGGAVSFTANSVTFIGSPDGSLINGGVVVSGNSLSPQGAYFGTSGASVLTATGFTFSPLTPSPVNPLWTYTFGSLTYSFDLSTVTVVQDTLGSFLSLTGTGTLFITGAGSPYDADGTEGTWTLTATGSGPTDFGFTAGNAAVPDGGTTVLLLGAALSGLALVKRKLTA